MTQNNLRSDTAHLQEHERTNHMKAHRLYGLFHAFMLIALCNNVFSVAQIRSALFGNIRNLQSQL